MNQIPNYNLYPQQPQRPNMYFDQSRQMLPMLKGRPVASIEEAKASSIDFDGSIFYFPNLASNRIYTKQINVDGTSSFNVYELVETPIAPTMPAPTGSDNWVSRDEFTNAINELLTQITELKTLNSNPPVKNASNSTPTTDYKF